MRNDRRAFFRVLFIVVIASGRTFAAVDGTPEQALLDMVTTSKAEVVEKHLPVATVDAIRHLPAADRQAAEQAILIGEKFRRQGLEPRFPDDSSALVELWQRGSEGDSLEATVNLVREIVSGGDALLELVVDGAHEGSRTWLVWMRLEEGEWRVTELQTGAYRDNAVFDTPAFVDQFRRSQQKETEAPVLAKLRALNSALITYAAIFPDIGFPDDLAALAPPEEGDDSTPERAGLLAADIAAQPYVSSGYVFVYQLLAAGPSGSYSIIARPVSTGKAGAMRFFTNESGLICSTSEDRDPTVEDDPME